MAVCTCGRCRIQTLKDARNTPPVLLLVLERGDLLQEVGDALALRQLEAEALEERQHLHPASPACELGGTGPVATACEPALSKRALALHADQMSSPMMQAELYLVLWAVVHDVALRKQEHIIEQVEHLCTNESASSPHVQAGALHAPAFVVAELLLHVTLLQANG